jgi:rhamnose utilization protein RhaD (predicted bifunctional aldolase and dehydrogenase)
MNNTQSSKSLKNDLKELSFYLGNNLDWVQGAGGNTSLKTNETLWVKASGYWLSDAKNDIFVPLSRKMVLDKISSGEEDLSSSRILKNEYQDLRPSIETTLHALMPHKFVIHTHSVNVISYAVLKDCKQLLKEKLNDLKWLWVPYVRPGLPLTKRLKAANISNFDVIILANHGLVIGADSKEEVLALINKVEKRLFRPLRKKSINTNVRKIINALDLLDYKLPKYDFCHSLAQDKFSMKVLSENALYPDHVIFLGPGKIPVISYEDLKNRIKNKTLNKNYKAIVIKELGVLVNKAVSENAEEMLHCLTNVLLKLMPKDKLQHLKFNDEADLLGWDAEKYRKLIKR